MLKYVLVATCDSIDFPLLILTYLLLCLLFSYIALYTLQVTFYEALKDLSDFGKQKLFPHSNYNVNSSMEGLLLGGLAGGVYPAVL